MDREDGKQDGEARVRGRLTETGPKNGPHRSDRNVPCGRIACTRPLFQCYRSTWPLTPRGVLLVGCTNTVRTPKPPSSCGQNPLLRTPPSFCGTFFFFSCSGRARITKGWRGAYRSLARGRTPIYKPAGHAPRRVDGPLIDVPGLWTKQLRREE